VHVQGAPSTALARSIGKSVVNSPLFQCAVAGNDPNVGRLVCAIGKHVGALDLGLDMSRTKLAMGGIALLANGVFQLDPGKEQRLIQHLKSAELYASVPPADGLTFRPPVSYPPHEQSVHIEIDLGLGEGSALVLGADRTHEYISENADYRS
jgi:glutamate N-acetyltransferase/amino-acid N-acetyltransferase